MPEKRNDLILLMDERTSGVVLIDETIVMRDEPGLCALRMIYAR